MYLRIKHTLILSFYMFVCAGVCVCELALPELLAHLWLQGIGRSSCCQPVPKKKTSCGELKALHHSFGTGKHSPMCFLVGVAREVQTSIISIRSSASQVPPKHWRACWMCTCLLTRLHPRPVACHQLLK